jgi:hypothetical protein
MVDTWIGIIQRQFTGEYQSVQREIYLNVILSTTNPSFLPLRMKPGLLAEKLVTNHLPCGTVTQCVTIQTAEHTTPKLLTAKINIKKSYKFLPKDR